MPRLADRLSPLAISKLKPKPGSAVSTFHAVGGVAGLHLQVTPTGGRSWVLRVRYGGKRRHIGLGPYPELSVSDAYAAARQAKDDIAKGRDPIAERRAAALSLRDALTFSQAMEQFLENKLAEFRNDKHRKQWCATLDKYAVPIIGDTMVAHLTVQDMLRTLEPIWTTKTETASRLRGRIEAVISWATVAGHRTGDNPARWKGNLDAIPPKPGKVAKGGNHPALALDDAADWFADLRGRIGTATRALEFVALTAARSGEVRGATWAEIDLDKAIWTIPADRMKMAREHRVPLTSEAVALLRALPRMEGSPYVFPALRGGMLTDMALSACMRRINEAREGGYRDQRSGRPAVPHGLRSTFRDWAAERTEFPRDMAEIALAHTVGSEVERAYRRSDMVERRRAMMAAWGRFLRGEAGQKVVAING
ncbi:tyrosine-type recombinase/integrase [Qingshengfaniella alkalisoli]|uniref:DUF4102 domain-containing protein n=1 Tax=Qingshengfaniella alkalisoli TaxID=2599296 RepID=A0A5B8IUK5_9RHOB|nr:site-specific integrase [Qingshengfaniella alkalisoli]QDY69802.1 DUF4102 domain-containing protein [Qingshengfaniella alkalisoli]